MINVAGSLKALHRQELVLEVEGEQSMTFRVTGKTRYFVDSKPVAAGAIPLGSPVEIDARPELNRELTAVRVVWRKAQAEPK